MKNLRIIRVTPENIDEFGIFCLKNRKIQGFQDKMKWFNQNFKNGLRLKILMDEYDNQIGFIEYIPIEYAWRPVAGSNCMFIHCIYIYKNDDKHNGYASMLINDCIEDAYNENMAGVSVLTSEGTWLAGKDVFLKNDFKSVDSKDRFDLLCYKFKEDTHYPEIINWESHLNEYHGWHLLYSDQCPMHEKAAESLYNTALDYNFHLEITKLESPEEIRKAPTGFGVFSLIHDGKLLADHYISATRFKNILKKEVPV